MAHWVECNNNKSAYVNLDAAAFADVVNIGGVEQITVHGPDGQTYTLTNTYASSADAIAALGKLLQGYTVP
ncbi:hypothetical protein [Amycolatopsis sp. VC5-11]|uniref:hypothetical protein n=1 Tax=Amycolatopsis sp. VC5-11 TaxID=3120156 RepID=UPI0030081A85